MTVTRKAFQGATMGYHLALPGGETIKALFKSHDDYVIGTEIGIDIAADHLILFAKN